MIVAAALAAIPAITTTTEIVGKGAEAGKQAVQETRTEAENVFARRTFHYDYEKVFFNSLYSMALVTVGWLALKLGQGTVGLTKWMNDGPLAWAFGPWIDDEMVTTMEIVGQELAKVDKVITPLMPALPIGMVAMQSALEYRRVRDIYDPTAQKVADAAIGGGALAMLYLAYSAWSKSRLLPEEGDIGDNTPGGEQSVGQVYTGPTDYILLTYRGITVYWDKRFTEGKINTWVGVQLVGVAPPTKLVAVTYRGTGGTNALIPYMKTLIDTFLTGSGGAR